MPKNKSNAVIKQASFLMIATMICRVIGLLYRTPLHRIMGDVGDGYYAFAFEWYSMILLIASYSIPMAVSKVMAELLAVKQYRNALDRFTYELPAGKRDAADEPMEVCAARELEEETGYVAGKLLPLITVNTTVAFCNEKIGIFAALDLQKTHQHLDADEEIELYEFTPEELLGMIREQKMTDSKTVAGILAYLTFMK